MPHPPLTETPAGLRDKAVRARRLAGAMTDELTVSRLNAFAGELEARAAALDPAAQTLTHREAVAVQQAESSAG